MTKKRRSNGFMYFADARRSAYEAENHDGAQLTAKKLVERATRDWKLMSEEERQKWRFESRRRRDEYQRQVHQMQSISIVRKSKNRQPSNLELSLQPKPTTCRLTESARKSLRQNIYQKLVWREKEDMTEVLAKKKFGFLMVCPYCTPESDEQVCVPRELWSSVINVNDGNIEKARILVHHDYPTNNEAFHQLVRNTDHGFSDNSPTSNHLDVHSACLSIADVLRGCWFNLILVPASHYQYVAGSLNWMKQKRDAQLKRDTASVRPERLICLEDMIAVIGRIFEVDVDDSTAWESSIDANLQFACDLHSATPSKCPVVIGHAACNHFLDVLRKLINQSKVDEHRFEFGDTQHRQHSPVTQTTHSNRNNPFRQSQPMLFATTTTTTTTTTTSNGNQFNSIRRRTPDRMYYVKEWLAGVDVNRDHRPDDW